MCLNKPSAREQLFSSYCLTKKTFMTTGKEEDLVFLQQPADLRAVRLRNPPRGESLLARVATRTLPQKHHGRSSPWLQTSPSFPTDTSIAPVYHELPLLLKSSNPSLPGAARFGLSWRGHFFPLAWTSSSPLPFRFFLKKPISQMKCNGGADSLQEPESDEPNG